MPVTENMILEYETLKIRKCLLPKTHYNDRVNKVTGEPVAVDMLVFHSASYDSEKLIRVFMDLGVSSHYIIDLDGTVIQLVDESKRAWHAGVGSWVGIEDINAHSIGIEVINPDFGHTIPYTQEQIKSLKLLSTMIVKRYGILPHNVFGHGDLAPTRKHDPGRLFPWEELAKVGVGIYPLDIPLKHQEKDVRKLLLKIGYSIKNEAAALRAFLRHFMPDRIPDKEHPKLEQYHFLSEYDKNLPTVLEKQPPANEEIIRRLNQVVEAFEKSRGTVRGKFR